MADFFFFTDVDLLNPQQQSEAFGPVGVVSGKDVFRVTSLHNASTNPKAYAICKGIVLIQNDTSDSTLVNLILKPIDQPGFDFPKIKYFIYRGILKEELINGDEIAAKTNNDLTKSLWTSQEARNKSANITGNPPKEAVGIDLSTSLGDLASMDEAFYRDNVDFQLPIVSAGWSLGKFKSSRFGIEIMVESIGFDPPMGKVRNGENRIEVTTLSSTPTQPEEFEHWHDKEEILNYIDPCAFFGMFYHAKIKVMQLSGRSRIMKGNEVYDGLLIKFYNKNNTYLDIRNEYNYSFNYFKNYGTSVKVSFDEISTPIEINYYRIDWPMLVLLNSDFYATNTINRNTVRIQMPSGNGDNPLPLMYVSTGYINTDYPKAPKDINKLIDLDVSDDGFTNELKLASANRNDLGNSTPISSYIKLKYFKRFDPSASTPSPVSSGTVIRAGSFMDNLFSPFMMKIPFRGTANVKTMVFDEELFIDAKKELGAEFIAKIGIAQDTNGITLFAFPSIIRFNDIDKSNFLFPFNIVGEKNELQFSFYNLITNRNKSLQVVGGKLNINSSYKETIELSRINYSPQITNLSLAIELFISINIPNNVMSSWAAEIANTFVIKYSTFLSLFQKEIGIDDIGQTYTSYNLKILGYSLLSNNLSLTEINHNTIVYTDGSI